MCWFTFYIYIYTKNTYHQRERATARAFHEAASWVLGSFLTLIMN
jgi:hypothetical protein